MYSNNLLVSGTCASGAFVSRMAASKYSGTEKDPAVDADPQLLNKAREKPQGKIEWVLQNRFWAQENMS